MKKHILKIVATTLALVMVMSTVVLAVPENGQGFGLTALAADGGACGANASWSLSDDGVLTISGTGPMTDYSWGEMPWNDNKDDIKSVVIGSGITGIGSRAFNGCTGLTSVSIPDNVTSIGDFAFSSCSSLIDITIPDGITSIGDYAFHLCYSLTAITIPDSVTSIGDYVFYDCYSLIDITIPDSVTSIGDSAFSSCGSLTSITLPDSITSIGEHAFSNCGSLTSITLPDNVTSIGDSAFSSCSSLIDITIPDGITSIGDYAFHLCYSLTAITIPDSVTSIGDSAFNYCYDLTNITIPESVTSIGDSAFSCSALNTITIKNLNCILFDSPDTIASSAVIYGYPESTAEAYANEYSRDFVLIGTEPVDDTSGGSLVWTLDSAGVLTISGTGAMDNYRYNPGNGKYSTPWYSSRESINKVVIGSGITSIGDLAFAGCINLPSIDIPNSVTSIGASAFSGCYGLTSISIPDSVTNIGESAFSSCCSLTSISIPDSVTDIGYGAFFGCEVLESVEMPDGITVINGGMFDECFELTDVVIPEGVTAIGDWAFMACTSLESISIPDGVISIGDHAFGCCYSLTSISIPESVTEIGNAFPSCTGLESINVDDNNELYCDVDGVLLDKSMETLICCPGGKTGSYAIPSGVVSIGDSAFTGCKNLTSVEIPSGVVSVGDSAFSGCEGLTSVEIPSGVVSICSNTFSSCVRLKSISIPSSVTDIYTFAFINCTELETITIYNPNCRIHDDAMMLISENAVIHGYTDSTAEEYADKYGMSFVSMGNAPQSGTCGENVTWLLDSDGLLTISGTGAMTDYPSLETPWFSSIENIKRVEIGSGVTHIGNAAFDCATNLTNVVIPDSVTSIGHAAFEGCESLTSVDIPNGVTYIGEVAFACCYGLTDIVIPDSVVSIGRSAFYLCVGLTGINIPEGVESIGSNSFCGCSVLRGISVDDNNEYYCDIDGVLFDKSVQTLMCYPGGKAGDYIVPDGVTSIDNGAFNNSAELTSIVIPESVTSIGDEAFVGCTALEALTILNPACSIGDSYYYYNALINAAIHGYTDSTAEAFADRYMLEFVSMGRAPKSGTCGENLTWTLDGEGLLTISGTGAMTDYTKGNAPWYDSRSYIETVTIGSGVTDIGNWSFCDCADIVSVDIPDSVTAIGAGAFNGCAGLRGISIPDSVTGIDAGAFGSCTGLVSVDIPDAVASIGVGAFGSCTALTSINVGENNEYYCDIDGVLFNASADTLLRYPSGKTGDYAIPEGVTGITAFAFSDCAGLTSVVLPDSITGIEDGVFWNCTGLTSVDIPEGITDIGRLAFNGCTGLEAITVMNPFCSIDTTFSIDEFYFGSVFPKNAVLYGYTGSTAEAYANEYGLEFVSIGIAPRRGVCGENLTWTLDSDGALTISGTGAMSDFEDYGAPWIESIHNINTINIGSGVTSIGDFAFSECSRLTDITIPDSVTSIGDYAFIDCFYLTSISIPGSVTSIGMGAFYSCISLTGITIPNGVTSIGNCAFHSCNSLTGITIPDSVTSIGDFAFQSCTGLTDITIPDSATSIGEGAFSNCSSLTGISIPDSVTSIGDNAFSNCYSLTDITVPNSVTSIGNGVFDECRSLTGITIPDGVTSIGDNAFSGCKSLTGITIPVGVTSVGAGAFSRCSGLTGITIPDGVKSIGDFAFYSCSGLTGITIPASVTSIGDGAFNGCTALETIMINNPDCILFDSSTTIESSAVIYGQPASTAEEYAAKYRRAFIPLTKAPTNLTAAAVRGKTVALAWDAFWDKDVVGYRIIRDGVEVGRVSDCEFIDAGLTTDTEYVYSVCGYYEGGEETEYAVIAVTPTAPKILSITVSDASGLLHGAENTICVTAANSGNLIAAGETEAKGALYYLDGAERRLLGEGVLEEQQPDASAVTYTVSCDVSALNDGEYTVVFVLTDVDGVSGERSSHVVVDNTPPVKITSVIASSDIKAIYLSWSISTEIGTDVYRIYRRSQNEDDFVLYATINGRFSQSYTDRNAKEDVTYYYYVVGVDSLGREGEPSLAASATLSEDTEKPLVTKLTPANYSFINGNAQIQATSKDNAAVTATELYYSTDGGDTWISFASAASSSITGSLNTTAFADVVIRVKAVARDAAGNESDSLIHVYSIDNTGPEQITGLAFTATSVTVTLSWNDVSDEDISYFRVEKKKPDGTYATEKDRVTKLGVNILSLTPGEQYTYRVVGYDQHGNRGTPSEDIVCTTLSDSTRPRITSISPGPGYYSSSITSTFVAEDEHNIAKITVQVSTDNEHWTDVHTATYPYVSRTRSLSYTLSLDDYDEGFVYLRAIAQDSAGNESDSSSEAPLVQHAVDKTAPAAPEGVSATGYLGGIQVIWTKGSEPDLGRYYVYRSTSEDGAYTLLSSGLTNLYYNDGNVSEGVDYFYKIRVNDTAGNVSDYSAAASAQASKDTEKPVVHSVYPKQGSSLGVKFNTISILASDNQLLSSIKIEYKNESASSYTLLSTKTNINASSKNITASLPVNGFSDGDTVSVRITAADKAGNESDSFETTYTIDAQAPAVVSAAAEFSSQNGNVLVSWSGGQESDLSGYRVYRKAGASGSYSLISQRSAVKDKSAYSCTDNTVSVAAVTYYYKIVAVDACGNESYIETSAVQLPDRSAPTAVITCESTMEVGVEYYIDATFSADDSGITSYQFDFGDGTQSDQPKPVHTFRSAGTYTVSLTVVDDNGNRSSAQKTVVVKDSAMIGTAKIRVVDDNGRAVSGAPVYFDLGGSGQVIKKTDRNGYASFTADAGSYTVGCIIADNEWLPTKTNVVVSAGKETAATMTLVRHVLIDGEFTITRMTFAEIVAAGIDISNAANQHYVKINVKLTYRSASGTTTVTKTVNWNMVDPKPVTIKDSDMSSTVTIYRVAAKYDEDTGSYTPTSIAYLVVPSEVSSLKEFFNVDLTIINYAAEEFSMVNNTVTLNVPKGLSLVNASSGSGTAATNTVHIDEIPGQSSETITWILRGDEIGEYTISADYSGVLSQFNTEIITEFRATEPIVVNGLSNLTLTGEFAETIGEDRALYYDLKLINRGSNEVYLPRVSALDEADEPARICEYDGEGNCIFETVFETDMAAYTEPDVLPPGYSIVKYYMRPEATGTNFEYELEQYSYEMENSYGLNVELKKKDLAQFKAEINAAPNKSYSVEAESGKKVLMDNSIYNCYPEQEVTLTAKMKLSDAHGLVWSCSDSQAVTFTDPEGLGGLDENGFYTYRVKATAKKPGTYTIKAQSGNGAYATGVLNVYAQQTDDRNGTFNFRSMFVNDENMEYSYHYDEEWFTHSSYDYQHDLTKMSMRLAMAAYGEGNNNTGANVKALLKDMEFTDLCVQYVTPKIDTVGYAIGSKDIHFEDGEDGSLVVVTVRGGGYGSEWGGNFRLGLTGHHEGFQIAADTVMSGLRGYLSKYANKLNKDNLKIWIVGYSRAAATSNLVAANLDNGAISGVKPEDVYAFCFECPQGVMDRNSSAQKYDNIVNIVNPIDFVPYVAMDDWKFSRYGKTYYLPGEANSGSSEYDALKDRMGDEYAAILRYNSIDFAAIEKDGVLPTTEGLAQAHALRAFWSTFANIVGMDYVDHLVSSYKINKVVGDGTLRDWFADSEYRKKVIKVVGEEKVNELGHAIFESDGWIDLLVESVYKGFTGVNQDRAFYCCFYEDQFIPLIANNLGGGSYDISIGGVVMDAVLILLGALIGNPLSLPNILHIANLFKKEIVQYGHYPELCLAWLDSLNGKTDYASSRYRTVFVNCPVDVTVYEEGGAVVARIIDDEVQQIEGGVGAYIDEAGQKVFILPSDMDYTLDVKATGDGTVTYTVMEYNMDTGDNERVISYYDVEITEGDVLTGACESLGETGEAQYTLIGADSSSIAPSVDQSGAEVTLCSVSVAEHENGLTVGQGDYECGQCISMTAIPDEEYRFAGWYCNGQLVSEEETYSFLVKESVVLNALFAKEYGISASPASPQPVNTDVELTAYGGSAYRFYYEFGGEQTVLQDFAPSDTCVWRPATPGEYTLSADIRLENGTVKTESISFTVEPPTLLYGDVNGDGEVSQKDATILMRYLVGWEGYVINEAQTDVNHDGTVSLLDATILRRALVGWEGYVLN